MNTDKIREFIDDWLFPLLLVLALVLAVAFALDCIPTKAVSEMNRKELHYDANSWFFMYDTDSGLFGIYDGCEPVRHIYISDLEIEPGVYPVLIYKGSEEQ